MTSTEYRPLSYWERLEYAYLEHGDKGALRRLYAIAGATFLTRWAMVFTAGYIASPLIATLLAR